MNAAAPTRNNSASTAMPLCRVASATAKTAAPNRFPRMTKNQTPAAFEPRNGKEIRRILTELAAVVPSSLDPGNDLNLRDINGSMFSNLRSLERQIEP